MTGGEEGEGVTLRIAGFHLKVGVWAAVQQRPGNHPIEVDGSDGAVGKEESRFG